MWDGSEILQEIANVAKTEKKKMEPRGLFPTHRPMRQITYYTKSSCPLCDESYPKVSRLAERYGLAITRVDIEADPELFALHRYRIPVVELEGHEMAWGRISERGLERKLRKALENRDRGLG